MGRKELRHELRKIRLSHDCIMGILARTAEHVGYYEEAKKIKSSKCIKSPICFKDRRTASKTFDRCYLAMNAIILAIDRRPPSEEVLRRITAILSKLGEKENRYQKISEIMLRKIKERGIAIDGSGKMMKTIVMEIIAKSLEDLYPRDSIDYKDIFEKIEAIANEML
jgi:DNA-directed RNA polymerase subunit F